MENRKRALILRVGGLGDCLILSPIAKQLYGHGYLVDVMFGSPTGDIHDFLNGLSYINSCKKITRVNGIDCIETEEKTFISVDIIRSSYDEVFDFKFSVEDNHVGPFPIEGWRGSINSNYVNWVDLSLAWANIDPAKISDLDKCPEIFIPDDYIKWAKDSLIGDKSDRSFRVIGIQLQASSLIRTWYKADELPNQIYKQFPEDLVVMFTNKAWWVLTRNGRQKIEFPEGNPLLYSAALVAQMDVFISADSGMSHVSEAVGTETITIYTTVPAWTRAKYYKHTYPIEATPDCYPCFTLNLFCPIEMKKAEGTLSDREREILIAERGGASIFEVARKFDTVPNAIMGELQSAKKRVEALSATEPACVKSITSQKILTLLGGLMPQKKQLKSHIINFQEQIAITEKVID